MINKMVTVLSDVSLSKRKGKFLSDKSYGFDTVYFIAKFILYYSENNQFNKLELRKKAIQYIEDLFQLRKGTAGAVNYYLETINLLVFGNVLTTSNKKDYFISQKDILEYIAQQPENAYVFIYLLVYLTLKNDDITDLYFTFTSKNDIDEKEIIINKMYEAFKNKSASIIADGSNWSKQLLKYAVIVLGYVNNQNYISRTLKVKDSIVTIEDVSLNISGTRTPSYLPKKNDYLQSFNLDYVKFVLKDYLFVNDSLINKDYELSENIAGDLANLKLAMLEDDSSDIKFGGLSKQQYIEGLVKTRNQSVQTQFKKGLLENNEHACPICGYSFENFLIASHIKPYSKCEDTYDAINHYNGFLMCPNHDKLFEDARYMTIDYQTGKIILSDIAKKSKEYGYLDGKCISNTYINNERRHYLQWHNNRFYEQNKQ